MCSLLRRHCTGALNAVDRGRCAEHAIYVSTTYSKKYRRGYGCSCDGVRWSLHLAGVWSQTIGYVFLHLAPGFDPWHMILSLASVSTSALRPTQPPSHGYRGSIAGVNRDRVVTLTTDTI
jgi:hypothetical protein